MSILAITGATGFVGGHLVRVARAHGHEVRALTRLPQEAEAGLTWVPGALDQPHTLVTLARHADAVIHVAGLTNGTDRAAFAAANVDGTSAMVEATKRAGVKRFVHVSSLAAREPSLSDYGWSKLTSEAIVTDSGLRWTIVRPPAVYGSGERDMFELFRMATRGVMLLPPGGRLSLIEVGDLARLLLALVPAQESYGITYEPDDGKRGGWDQKELAHALGEAVGRKAVPFAMPERLLRFAAAADGLIRRKRARLTPDRVRYFSHPDWVANRASHPPDTLWRPEVETRAGLKATAAWYRAAGWL